MQGKLSPIPRHPTLDTYSGDIMWNKWSQKIAGGGDRAKDAVSAIQRIVRGLGDATRSYRERPFSMVNSGVPKRPKGPSFVRRNPNFSYRRIADSRNGVVLRKILVAPSAAAQLSTCFRSADPTPDPLAAGKTAMPRM